VSAQLDSAAGCSSGLQKACARVRAAAAACVRAAGLSSWLQQRAAEGVRARPLSRCSLCPRSRANERRYGQMRSSGLQRRARTSVQLTAGYLQESSLAASRLGARTIYVSERSLAS
jgi:hypothetical protein